MHGSIPRENIRKYENEQININDRILEVKLMRTPVNLNVIQVYALTSLSSQKEIDRLYGALMGALRNLPNSKRLLVLGDFNAKIGIRKHDSR